MTRGDRTKRERPAPAPHTRGTRPQEMPAVRTTIVGGRPPGCGKSIGQIPRGIEVLVKKAAVDPAFRVLLLTHRAAAADEIGLALEPAEVLMLNHVPAGHLAAIINRTNVDSSRRTAFLGKVAGVMLAALGASAGGNLVGNGASATAGPASTPPAVSAPAEPAGQPRDVRAPVEVAGVRARPTTQPARPDQLRPVRGVRVWRPPSGVAGATVQRPQPPATQPASQPTTQPTTRPALSAKEFRALLRKLDDDKFTVRDAAHKKLQGQGLGILPALRKALKNEKLSVEVRLRVESIVTKLAATTRPAPSITITGQVICLGLRVRNINE